MLWASLPCQVKLGYLKRSTDLTREAAVRQRRQACPGPSPSLASHLTHHWLPHGWRRVPAPSGTSLLGHGRRRAPSGDAPEAGQSSWLHRAPLGRRKSPFFPVFPQLQYDQSPMAYKIANSCCDHGLPRPQGPEGIEPRGTWRKSS